MILAAVNSHALWYLTRATGLVSLVLLTATTVSGDTGVVRFTSTAVITTAALSGRYSGADGGLR